MSSRRKSPDVGPLNPPAAWVRSEDPAPYHTGGESAILAALERAGCANPEAYLPTIQGYIRFTRARLCAKEEPGPVSKKRLGDELARVEKHAGALLEALGGLSPAARDALEQSGRHGALRDPQLVDWHGETLRTLDIAHLVGMLQRAAATWREPVTGTDVPKVRLRRGRRDPAKWWFVESLANVYQQATGKAPRVWPSKDGSGQYEGPFPELARAAWAATTHGLPPEEGGGPPWLDHYLAEACKLFKGT
ncbi:MAG: hypothetical protein AB1578_21885 [Thermodesulfobacteriota bacterium]